MLKNKKTIIRFISIIFLMIVPFIATAQLTSFDDLATRTDLPVAYDLSDVIVGFMEWLLRIVGAIGIIGFVISGILYFTAAGDSNQIEKAKNAMTYSIIGVVVALIGYVIIQSVDAMLRNSFF